MCVLTDFVLMARRHKIVDPWEGRHLMRMFELISEVEAEDARSWSRIWYVMLYAEFYTNLGCALWPAAM